MQLYTECTFLCCRENLPAVFAQSHRAVWAAEEARPGRAVPDTSLPRQNLTQVRTCLTVSGSQHGIFSPHNPDASVIRSQLCYFCTLVLSNLFDHRPLILDVIGSFRSKRLEWFFFLLRRFALTTKIPDTKGCHKCCIGEWPLPSSPVLFPHLSIILQCVNTRLTSRLVALLQCLCSPRDFSYCEISITFCRLYLLINMFWF